MHRRQLRTGQYTNPCEYLFVVLLCATLLTSPGRTTGILIRRMTALKARALGQELQRAAAAIAGAKAMVITAGAGMSVDSGLPDFRGKEGFWQQYPPLKNLGINLKDINQPRWFDNNPHLAWGFFGHCYNLYQNTTPHEGFRLLKKWADNMEHGYFVYTSNVDGHFQRTGFSSEHIVECHGSIHNLQCVHPRSKSEIWSVPEGTVYDVDPDSLMLKGTLPHGPDGHEHPILARPNILMFGDWNWLNHFTNKQEERFTEFKKMLLRTAVPFVVIELGAGLAVPTVRIAGEDMLGGRQTGVLIRINAYEHSVPQINVSLPLNSLEALRKIQMALEGHLNDNSAVDVQ